MPSINHRSHQADSQISVGTSGVPASVALLPVSVVALGTPSQPVESMMTLQSGLNRFMRLVTSFEWPRRKPSVGGRLALRLR